MPLLIPLAALFGACFLVPSAFAGDKPTAQELIRAEIEASGAESLRDASAVYVKYATSFSNGIRGTYEDWTTREGISWSKSDLGQIGVLEFGVYQGKAWSFTPKDGAQLLSEDKAWPYLQGADMDRAADPDRFSNLGEVSPARVAGVGTWKLELDVAPGEHRVYYFDRETGLQVAQDSPNDDGGMNQTVFSDFTTIDGRTVAKKWTMQIGEMEVVYDLVEFDIDPPDLPSLVPRYEVLTLIDPSQVPEHLIAPTISDEEVVAGLSIPDVATGTTAQIPIGYELPEKMAMLRFVDSRRVKGTDKEGDCRAALLEARQKVSSGDYRFAIEDHQITDSAECKVNKRGKAVVSFVVVTISDKPTAKISELYFEEAWELIQAIRKAPTIGKSDLDSYSFRINERDGGLFFVASGSDDANTWPASLEPRQRAAKAFFDSAVLGGNDLADMLRLLEAVPDLDGVEYKLQYRVRTGPETSDDEEVLLVFRRGSISENPRASLRAVEAILVDKVGVGRQEGEGLPLDLDEELVPETR